MSRPKILIARAISPEVVEALSQHFDVTANPADVAWSPAELTAPLGAKAAHRLPVTQLKKIFGGILLCLATYMLYKSVAAWHA